MPRVAPSVNRFAEVRALAFTLATVGQAGCVYTAAAGLDPGLELSLGTPSRGYLRGGVSIAPRGAGFELFRTRAQGGELYGTRRLVHAVDRAARYVVRHAAGGAPLRVGDLSGRRGGRLSRHTSHRTGRDVDLIFYARDATTGRSVPAPAFVRYDAQGASLDPAYPTLAFDTARNWALVEALVRDERAGVLRIFCAEWLRVMLVEYARAHGRDPEVVARAALVLRQPSDSAPHDDHFHVRVACAPGERALGCQDGAPLWWWLERAWARPDVVAPADDETVLAALADAPPPAPLELPVVAAAGEGGASRGASGPSLRELRAPLAALRGPRRGYADELGDDAAVSLP